MKSLRNVQDRASLQLQYRVDSFVRKAYQTVGSCRFLENDAATKLRIVICAA